MNTQLNYEYLKKRDRFSKPQVMESAAGFYIGYTVDVDGDPQPYARLSMYFETTEAAQDALDSNDYFI